MSAFLARVLTLFRRRRRELELDDEIRGHLDLLAADYERRGLSPPEARRAARRDFGAVQPMKERYRDLLRFVALDDFRRDIGYAMRALRRTPAFTLVAVLTIGLGIGANTAIFSVIEAVLLRALPVHEPHRLSRVVAIYDGRPLEFSYPLVQELARRELFDSVFGFASEAATVGESGSLERVTVAVVTGAYFETLGVLPAAGRLLRTGDETPGAAPVVVLGYGYWQRRFGGALDAVGRPIWIDGVQFTIAGVTPAGFNGIVVGRSADVTLPLGVLAHTRADDPPPLATSVNDLMLMVRRRDLSNEEARSRLQTVWREVVETAIPPSRARTRALQAQVEVVPGGRGWTALLERFTRPLLVLMTIVGVVMLIACANVANLLLARMEARRHEAATRLALGAGRARLVRQVLIESLLLSTAGALMGLGIAWTGSRTLLAIVQRGEAFPLAVDVSPDARVAAFTAALALATALLFGAVPAWRAAGVRASHRGGEWSRGRPRARSGQALVAAQVALSVLLLVMGGLFVRTLQNLRAMDAGFRHENVLTFMVTPPDDPRSPASATFLEGVRSAVRQLPGVRAVSFAGATPVGGASIYMRFVVKGQPAAEPTLTHFIAPGYIDAIGMTLHAGRDFTPDDHDRAPLVAIVNEAFVARHLGDGHPLTEALALNGPSTEGRRIVGVVGDAIHNDLRSAPPAAVYVPFAQMSSTPAGFGAGSFAVAVDPSFSSVAAIRNAVERLVAGPPTEIRSLTDQVARTLVQERLMALLAGAFAVLALVLAAVGLYGLLSYAVSQRTSELGVRTALGAMPVDVVRLVMCDASRMIGAGIAAGLPLAWIASNAVRTMLFRLEPTDPSNIATALAVLALTSAVAAYLPARRASRVDPVIALRAE